MIQLLSQSFSVVSTLIICVFKSYNSLFLCCLIEDQYYTYNIPQTFAKTTTFQGKAFGLGPAHRKLYKAWHRRLSKAGCGSLSDTEPSAAPNSAPSPIGTPESTVYAKALNLERPPARIGTAIAIPSGMSWMIITAVIVKPSRGEASKPEPTAKPSGKLCMAMAIAIRSGSQQACIFAAIQYPGMFQQALDHHYGRMPVMMPGMCRSFPRLNALRSNSSRPLRSSVRLRTQYGAHGPVAVLRPETPKAAETVPELTDPMNVILSNCPI